jgi:uncharacterized membrane protein YozB (DUF420 family)
MSDLELHPLLNAALNMTSAALLVSGYFAIKSGERDRHKRFMLSALVVSAAFLVSYLIRFVGAGEPKPFPGEGGFKVLYLGILFSHMILAAAVPVLAIGSVWWALKREDFVRHKKWAKLTFPIWTYVSVTGVIVYAMLWHWPGS